MENCFKLLYGSHPLTHMGTKLKLPGKNLNVQLCSKAVLEFQ